MQKKFSTDNNDEDTLKKKPIKSEIIVITQESLEVPLIIFII